MQDIKTGDFVNEYCGEIVGSKQIAKRFNEV